MKHIKYLILTLVMLFSVDVYAAGIKIGNDSTEPGATNRKVTVELTGSDLKDYTGVEFSISINGTSYASYEFNYNASMTYKPVGNTFSITNSSGLYEANIGNIVYSTTKDLNSNFTLTPTNVNFIKSDGSKVSGTSVSGNITYIQTKSSDASLTSLTVSKGKLVPDFSKDVQGYTVTLEEDVSSIDISADTAPGATKTGTGMQTLDSNNKTFNIVVTAEDGKTSKTYSITVLKGDGNKEISTYLKSLKINTIGCKLSPKFNKKNTKYSVDITDDINKLDFEYETENPSANVKISGNKNFVSGKNTVKITVTSPDNSKKTVYKVTVNKKSEKIVKKKKKETQEKSSNKKLLIIIIVIIILLIGLFIVLFKTNKLKFLNKLKKEKGENPKKDDKTGKKKDKKNKKDKKKKPSKDKKHSKNESRSQKYYSDDENIDEDEFDETTNYNSEDFLDKYEEELVKTKEFNIKDFK